MAITHHLLPVNIEQIANKELTFEHNQMNIKELDALGVKIFIQMLIKNLAFKSKGIKYCFLGKGGKIP